MRLASQASAKSQLTRQAFDELERVTQPEPALERQVIMAS